MRTIAVTHILSQSELIPLPASGQALYQEILDAVSPYTGGIVAKATLQHQSAEMGLTPDTIAAQHIPELAERITKGLSAFVGPDLAGRAGQLIRSLG